MDRIAWAGVGAGEDAAHDTGLPMQRAVFIALNHRLLEAGLQAVDLGAWVAHSGDIDLGGFLNAEPQRPPTHRDLIEE